MTIASAKANAYLKEYLKTRKDAKNPEAPLFVTSHGEPCSRIQLYKALRNKQRPLGLATGPHALRHTFISEAEKIGSASIARDLAITLDDQVLRMKTSTQTFFSPVAILLMAMMDQKSVVTKAIADQVMELGQTRLCKEARIAKANKKEDRLMMADKEVKWIIKRLEEGMTNEEYCIEATKFAKLFLKGNLCMLRAGTTIN